MEDTMPQGRIVLKRICQSRKLAELKTDGARLLYTWLIPNVDVNGCYSGDAEVIKGQIFTRLKKSVKIIEKYLLDLKENDLIVRYIVNGDIYLQIPDFSDKQPYLNPDRESKTNIPLPTQDLLMSNSSTTPSNLGQIESKSKSKIESKSKPKFIPPTLNEIIEYVKEKSYTVDVKKFFEYYTESDPPWHDREGKPVRNWKQKIIAVWNKPGKKNTCRNSNCEELGVYTSTDDTGQVCWWCEKHKQGWKPSLPKELTENTLKTVPSKEGRSLSDKQNEQKNKLGVR